MPHVGNGAIILLMLVDAIGVVGVVAFVSFSRAVPCGVAADADSNTGNMIGNAS